MTFEQAKEKLKDWILPKDGGLFSLGTYISWTPGEDAVLDGRFTLEELEAIVIYMKEFIA